MIDPLAADLSVTWLGAAGCVLYAWFLWRHRSSGFAIRATLFLVVTVAWVLFVRGFYWALGSEALGRLVFAGATLLPLAITSFTEALLRRHHPLWLKAFGLGATLVFFAANLFLDLAGDPWLLSMFCAALAAAALANAWMLLRADAADLSRNELHLARGVLIVALAAVPLMVTDFRETFGSPPVRAGAIGALLFVCVHLGLSGERGVVVPLLGRLAVALAAAALLAGSFALALVGVRPGLTAAALQSFPIAFAWVLLSSVFLQVRAASLEGRAAAFLRWLSRARLDSAAGFLASLRWLPQMQDHLVLEGEALRGYALEPIFAAAGREPLSLAEVRAWARGEGGGKIEAGEQLRDLLERNDMTHALLVSAAPPLVLLLNLPSGAQEAAGHLRASVILHMARRLARRPQDGA